MRSCSVWCIVGCGMVSVLMSVIVVMSVCIVGLVSVMVMCCLWLDSC